MAARGARAAGEAACADRIPSPLACRPIAARGRRIPGRASRSRLRRRPEHSHRVSLHRGRRGADPRSAAGAGQFERGYHRGPRNWSCCRSPRDKDNSDRHGSVGPDLVALGLVESLAHLGGNVTGSTFFLAELLAKRLELLKELAPSMTRTGILLIRRADSANTNIEVVETSAKALKLELHPIEVRGPSEFESAFAAWADAQIGGFIMGDHSLLTYNAGAIATLAAKHQFPSIGPLSLPENGGLMGYGVNFLEIFHRAAYFVDKILRGTKPGDIPIEQPTKFKSVVNLKTAKSLGIDIPTSILLRADDVIE